MDERELEPEETAAGNRIDELGARSGKLVERRPEVVRLHRDMVHSGATTGEEATDGSVVFGRRHQLEPALSDEERRGLDALLHELLPPLETRAEERRVRGDRLVEVGDGDAEMVDAAHAGDATRASVAALWLSRASEAP